MNNITSESEEAVAEWNADLANVLIPNTVILSLYLVLGLTGNTLVIIVYGFRMKKKSDDRYFIPFLAVSDCFASVVCASFTIALNMMQAAFTNWRLCKTWWFFAAFSTFMSIFLLLVIATHRYLKLCRPFSKQMTLQHKRLAVGLSLLLAIVMAAPTTVLYGSVAFPNNDGSLIGWRCSKIKDVNKAGSLGYGVIVVLVILVAISVMVCLYGKIGHKIYHHFKYSTTVSYDLPSKKDIKSVKEKSTTSFSNEELTTTTTTKSTLEEEVYHKQSERNDNPKQISAGPKNTHEKTNEQRNKRIMHKFTAMFMIITIVFLICYIPKVILMVIEGLNPTFWENFTDSQRAGVLFIYRFYIVNNVINPFIYAFMDPEFRQNTKSLFKCAML